MHIVSLGGTVATPSTFDASKSFKVSTADSKYMKPPGLGQEEEDKYDPTKVSQMTEFLKKERHAKLEKSVESREVKIFNAQGTGQNLKQFLMHLDEKEAERLKALRLTEEKLEQEQGNLSAMRFLGEQEKKSKFQNKRYAELDKLINSPNHTRTSIRVKFPDGYILQGTFGALENVGDIHKFVQDHLFYKADQRQFYLYETPPKKVFDEKSYKTTLNIAKLVPSCMIYFGWKDLDETKQEHGPFLNLKELQDKIV